jgi:hypothetical protein
MCRSSLRTWHDRGCHFLRAHFAYPPQRVLIYAESLVFHSSIRQRVHDTRQTNDLQNLGYRVFRFLSHDIPGPQRSLASGFKAGKSKR